MATNARKATVRPARAAEAPQLTAVAFAAKRHWGYPDEWIRAWTEDLTVTPEYIEAHDVVVADSDGTVIAFVGVRRDDSDCIAHIDHLWVTPSSMGAGIGARLLAQAVVRATAMNATALRIVSDPNAEGFYIGAGARRVGMTPSTPPGRLLPVLELELGTQDRPVQAP